MNEQERAALWKLSLVCAQNHYSFPHGNGKHCMFSICIYNTEREGCKEKGREGWVICTRKTEAVRFPLPQFQ